IGIVSQNIESPTNPVRFTTKPVLYSKDGFLISIWPTAHAQCDGVFKRPIFKSVMINTLK
ncbi:hypothetical protein, partial [Acinetobacter baumannii]